MMSDSPLARPYCVAALFGLRVRDLAALETTSREFRKVLTEEKSASKVWAAAASAFGRSYNLTIGPEAFDCMPLPDLKRMTADLAKLRGSGLDDMNSLTREDLYSVQSMMASIGEMHLQDGGRNCSNLQLIVGRLRFDAEDVAGVLEATTNSPAHTSDDDLFCFSSEIGFKWPGRSPASNSTELTLAVGCRPGDIVIEVVTKNGLPCHSALTLCMDVYFPDPRLPASSTPHKISNLEVDVDGASIPIERPILDIGNPEMRSILESEEGVLCVIAIRAGKWGFVCKEAPHLLFASSMPCYADKMPPTMRSVNALALEIRSNCKAGPDWTPFGMA
eukprot:gnl/TRDRNA2_/TRDRNA2_173612_c0_seq1.p1 gnl/TRDRNA2_/TRDRNA2_173612_c0~~gnl/TRDRNA2_/TRDRNA2_173612_c0_seq1.p1  ORF type:complete len:333 (+),score=55.19 gnl/TRDRNA2_/TRDRNA2_173612_c0_seq1:130-1128(+)